ncbi:hypothetical protein niasHS_013752 [Heterodera schachtii]|uniref:Major facilitator superfamily (MFS) profile domain-containing protein n=1 Tax=Heterodera schachtii TaxID=97005 RepID=A0ABD2IWI1_HETSC
MSETNFDKVVTTRDQEQREKLISKAKEGLVETTTEPDGSKRVPPPIKDGRYTKSLIFATLSIVFGSSFQFGFHIGATNIPGDHIQKWLNETHANLTGRPGEPIELSTSKLLMGAVAGCFALGGMIGGVSVGTVSDKFGRRKPLLFNNFVAAIAAVLLIFSTMPGTYYFLLYLGRFIIGINSGLNSGLAPMYLMELSPANLRGSLGSFPQLFVTIAILCSQLIGLPGVLGDADKWNYIFAFTFVPVIAQLCTLPFCPESPKYNLIVQGLKEEAENDLKKLRGDDDVRGEMEQMDAESIAIHSQPLVRWGNMFRAPLVWPLVLAMFMMVSQQLSGINAVMFYSSDIFKSAGLDKMWQNIATCIMGAVNVSMTVVSVYMVERSGRRTLHLIGLLGTCVTTALLAASMHISEMNNMKWFAYMSILFVQLFVIAFATGPGSIPWFYVSELFPSNARGNANSLAVLTNWSTNMLVVVLFPFLNEALGKNVFFLFTLLLIMFILFAFKFLPETKNKTLEEVQVEMDRLRGKKRA